MNKKVDVLITDYAWPDIDIERNVLAKAGYSVVAGPPDPGSAEEIEALMKEHQPDAVLFCWAPVTKAAIASAPSLKIAARLGVGLDNLAVDACTDRGIWVTNVPDYCIEEVSDHAIAMLLAWARGILPFDRNVRSGIWDPSSAKLRRISDLTCGIIGYGNIGRKTASKLSAFGVNLLVHSKPAMEDNLVTFVTLDELTRQSDVIIVHVPLNDSTYHLINEQLLSKVKPGAMLINVSRGGVVDTDALLDALDKKQLSGAGLDVLEYEPSVPDALRLHPNTILTPHVAFSSDASLTELRRRAAEDVVRVLQGKEPEQPRNKPRTV